VEAVNSIALGRGYLLAALFGLTALRLAVAAASPAGRRWWWGMAIGVATLAFLSHEIGAVAVLLMAVVWLQGHDRRQVWLRRMGLITAAATGLVVALLLPWLAGGARGLYASLEAFSTVAVLSIKQLFVPVPLCLWFDATAVGHAALKGPAAEIALTVALLLLGLTYAGRADCLWRSVLLMVLSLSPVLARHLMPFPLPSILGERWLYLPAAFLAIWAGFLAQSWRDGMGGGQRMAVKLGAGVLLAALMSAGTSGAVYSAVESRHWRDNVTLFEHATQHCPPSAYLRAALGKAYYDRGQMADATAQLLAAAAIDPTFARARIGLGLVALESGRLVDALRELTAAIELAPSDSDAHNGLGELYFRLGRSEAAIHEFQLAVAIRPWHVVYRWNLALALMKADRLTEALAQWERVLAVSPDPGDQATAREEIELLNRALAGRRGL
jgi:tetratricopeptide (TPR) repeat protein